MRIAIIQFSVCPGNIKLNEQTTARLIEQAAACRANVIVLPELWNCGYDLAHLPRLAQDSQGSSISLLKKLALKYGIFIFGGSFAEKKNGAFYNTAMVIDQKGLVAGKYRKIHLFPLGLEEDKYFSSGEEWGLVETPWGLAGVALCYDIRFPELVRNLVLRGARYLVVPAQWPESRLDHWITLCKARAIENQVFLFAANRTGQDEKITYPGTSLIISPWGHVIKSGSGEPEIVIADIDFNEIEEARGILPVFSDRRGILDEIDNSQV